MNTTLAQSSSQAILNNSSLPLFFHNSSTDDSTQPHSATDYGLNAGTLQHQSNHIPTLPAAIRLASAPTRRTNSRNGDPLNSPAPTIYVPDQQRTFSSSQTPQAPLIGNPPPRTPQPDFRTRLSRLEHYTIPFEKTALSQHETPTKATNVLHRHLPLGLRLLRAHPVATVPARLARQPDHLRHHAIARPGLNNQHPELLSAGLPESVRRGRRGTEGRGWVLPGVLSEVV
jgi:hypothetical protein